MTTESARTGRIFSPLILSIVIAVISLAGLVYFNGKLGTGLWYDIFVFPFVYVGTIIVLGNFLAGTGKRPKALAVVVVGAFLLLAFVATLSPNSGYPVPSTSTVYLSSCTTTTYTNSTAIYATTTTFSFANTETFTNCSNAATGTSFLPIGLIVDFFFWLPISGTVVYALPFWRIETTENRIARAISCAVLFVAVLVPMLNILPVGPL